MNVLIGPNNAGKSSILRGLHLIQQGIGNHFGDVRVGATTANVEIKLEDINIGSETYWFENRGPYSGRLSAEIKTANRREGNITVNFSSDHGNMGSDCRLPNIDPGYFIVPYLSRRKAADYGEDIRESNVRVIQSDVSNLAARLSKFANPSYPRFADYEAACKKLLGFVVTAVSSVNGQRPGRYLPDGSSVPIEQMGEGVPNIVLLLISLVAAKGKLFLIEEPENDLHPTALKGLLDLIVTSSKDNQFVISTHSNIVVRHLCGMPESKLFKVSAVPDHVPTESSVSEVDRTAEARIAVLEELGYSFADFDLWDGWLICEESSAERIIRDYLVPMFTPKLTRVRTIAANGVNRIQPLLDDFCRLMLFTHMQPAYVGRTWVRTDGDQAGLDAVNKLTAKFSDWPAGRIGSFPAEQFERFYPRAFSAEIDRILALPNTEEKREQKRQLLNQVVAWLDEDQTRAKAALSDSAAAVISDLRSIEASLRD